MPDESTLTGRPVAFTWLQFEGNSLELKNPASHRNEAKNRLEMRNAIRERAAVDTFIPLDGARNTHKLDLQSVDAGAYHRITMSPNIDKG